MRQKLEYQADRIEAVLAIHKVPARVTGGTVTPRWIRFQVLPALGARISRIKRLSEELATALDTASCRVSRRGAAVTIEVPRDDPQPVRLLPLYRQLTNGEHPSTAPSEWPSRRDGAPPVTAILGLAEDGAPLLIRLPSPDVAHILVAGTTGSGKTVLMQAMILSLAMTNPAPCPPFNPRGGNTDAGLALVLIDPKGHAFGHFEGLPHLARPVIREPEEAAEALNSLVRLMERRHPRPPRGHPREGVASLPFTLEGVASLPFISGGSSRPLTEARGNGTATEARPGEWDPSHIVVVIDELADLLMTGGKPVQRALTRLTQRGREVGIHVVAATQKPTTAVLGPLVKANFPVRLVGHVTSITDARTATGWSGTGAERLMGRGDFLAVAEGRVIRFQAAHVSPQEIREVVACLAQTTLAPTSHTSRVSLPRAPVRMLTDVL